MSFRQIVATSILAAALAGNVHDRAYYEAKFFNWMQEHKHEIGTGANFVRMIQNFADNEDFINAHNSQKSTFTVGHNQFSHMSSSEFAAYVNQGGIKKAETEPPAFIHEAPTLRSSVPAEVDWIAKGAVTPVKDQGQCGSCWAFATTGAIEGAYFNKHGALESWSEQNLVDCDNFKNHFGRDKGCNGGMMDNAYSWIKRNGGICTEAAYPYVSGTTKTEGECVDKNCINPKSVPQSYVDVKKNSDDAMMSALNVAPVAVAIQADDKAFQLYKSGVLTEKCGTSLNHGVLVTGYGTLDGIDYYNVKNSWGTSWGDNGYIKLQRGGDIQKEGQCGVLTTGSYVIV